LLRNRRDVILDGIRGWCPMVLEGNGRALGILLELFSSEPGHRRGDPGRDPGPAVAQQPTGATLVNSWNTGDRWARLQGPGGMGVGGQCEKNAGEFFRYRGGFGSKRKKS